MIIGHGFGESAAGPYEWFEYDNIEECEQHARRILNVGLELRAKGVRANQSGNLIFYLAL
jgi:hypothetical protein